VKDDPFESLFESIDPIRGLTKTEIDAAVSSDRILNQLHKKIRLESTRQSRRRFVRLVTISAVFVLVVVGTAVVITFLRPSISDTSLIKCFSQDSLQSSVIAVKPYGSKPFNSCQALFHGRTTSEGATPTGFVCVLANGELGGFPSSKLVENCSKLGLATYDGKLRLSRILKFESAAHRFFSNRACVSSHLAHEQMRRLLSDYELRGWLVIVSDSDLSKACVTIDIQPQARVVSVVAIGRSAQN
jgi:hypothetical protein